MSRPKKQLLDHLDQIPPCMARLCARTWGRAKTLVEIQKDSGLSYRKTNWISRQPTWARIRVKDAVLFSKACGLDLFRPRQKLHYLRRALAQRSLKIIGRGLPHPYVVRQIAIWADHFRATNNRDRTG